MLHEYLFFFPFQMSAAWAWIPTVFLSFLMLRSAAAQSQMCEEPFQAAFMVITNLTYPASRSFLDSDLVFYREILRFTTEETDREREAALQFFIDTFGLDFTNVEPDEQGQRILGNATFLPVLFPFNNTVVFNTWLVNGRARTRCYPIADGGFQVSFTGTVMLHGEYGGEEGRLGFPNESVFYGHNYLLDVCEQQGILLQVETPTPSRVETSDGWTVAIFRARNRVLGEGVIWGIGRLTAVDSTTVRVENRQIITFL